MSAFVLVSPERVSWWWSSALPHIERVLKRGHGSYKPADVLDRCLAGSYRLWLCFDGQCVAAVVTEFCNYPQLRTCIVRMLGGRLPPDWNDHLNKIHVWAKEQGCSAMEVFGREGWARKLDGYELQQVVMRKEL